MVHGRLCWPPLSVEVEAECRFEVFWSGSWNLQFNFT
jgi:hypothetical protein